MMTDRVIKKDTQADKADREQENKKKYVDRQRQRDGQRKGHKMTTTYNRATDTYWQSDCYTPMHPDWQKVTQANRETN